MSFTPTERVDQGDVVSSTTFQDIKDNIYAIYDMIGTEDINVAAAYNPEHGIHYLQTEDSFLTIFHTYQYLVFGSSGQVVDPSGIGASVSLSDPDSGYGILELESVNWLTYGMMYRVEGVTWAREVEYL
jgi:hypothetical protein